MDKPGFKIDDQVYPFPERFRLGDPVLVEEVTNIDFQTFSERLDEQNANVKAGVTDKGDPVVLAGLVAVAIWQANPRWKLDRVVAFAQQLDLDGFETVGGDDGPPAVETAEGSPLPVSSSESTTTLAASPEGVPV